MDGEEKKLLPNPKQSLNQRGIVGFGLHCFPDIVVDEAVNIRRCSPKEENFRRLTYENIGSNDTDTASQADGDGTCRLRKDTISTAQLNEQAYQKGFSDGLEKGMFEGENTWYKQAEKKITTTLEQSARRVASAK